MANKIITKSTNKTSKTVLSPEAGSAFVRVAHKISSNKTKSQVIKINGKFFRVKELG